MPDKSEVLASKKGKEVKDLLIKLATDIFEGAVAGAVAVLVVTDLDTANAKVLLAALLVGALNGAIAASRRRAVARVTA